MKRWISAGLACAFLFGTALVQGQALPDQAPAAPVEEKRPEPKVSDSAKELLKTMKDGYAGLKSLDAEGQVSLNLDAAGEKEQKQSAFTGSYQAPVSFRHEMKDDMLVVSNGEKAYVYKLDRKLYIDVEAPKERAELPKIADPIVSYLQQQNPTLLLALTPDAGASFIDGVESVDRGPDVTLDGTAFPALVLKSAGQEITALIHPTTGLVRRMSIDLKGYLVSRNVPQVNSAMITIDYTKSAANAPVAAETFAWVPPAEATLVKLPPPEEMQQGPGGDAMALVGKAAPAFELKDLNSENVTLASLKGNVVVLDFWATWCGPCVQSMPHLDALNKDLAPKGLKVFAVNIQEAPALVKTFLNDKKLNLPVLMDPQGDVAKLYQVTGIPQTVVIGKDGNIARVFVGFGPGGEDELRQAVEAAMK